MAIGGVHGDEFEDHREDDGLLMLPVLCTATLGQKLMVLKLLLVLVLMMLPWTPAATRCLAVQ